MKDMHQLISGHIAGAAYLVNLTRAAHSLCSEAPVTMGLTPCSCRPQLWLILFYTISSCSQYAVWPTGSASELPGGTIISVLDLASAFSLRHQSEITVTLHRPGTAEF